MSDEIDDIDNDPSTELPADDSTFVVEEKKPMNRSTLVLFGLIVAGVGGTYLMMMRAGPASAAASTTEAQAADKTITQFLSSGSTSMKLMESMLRNTEKVVQQFLSYPSMTQIPLSDLHTNPFRHSVQKPSADKLSEAVTKKREEERLAALKAVQTLQLQSIMVSESRKAAMINNTLVQEGQQVDEFSVEKINPGAVVVRTGAYRFELKMQK